MRKARAVKDRILAPFLAEAENDLRHQLRFKFRPIIKRLDVSAHAGFIFDNIKVIRKILEETFGPLTPINADGEVAGRGKGKHTVGYVRAVGKYADLVDESLKRKRQTANGIEHHHNDLAAAATDDDKTERPLLIVQTADATAVADVKRAKVSKRDLKPDINLGEGLSEEAKAHARRVLMEMFK